jgi:hypothetical protein
MFISEPIQPVEGTFDSAAMATGMPGLPQQFFWRGQEHSISAVLEVSKGHGDCRNGSGERYVRRHEFRIRTKDGTVMRLYFQRSMGRGKITARTRWMLHSIEKNTEPATALGA